MVFLGTVASCRVDWPMREKFGMRRVGSTYRIESSVIGAKKGRFEAGWMYLLILGEENRLFSHPKIRAVRFVELFGLPTLSERTWG